jgi:hypothetical protein
VTYPDDFDEGPPTVLDAAIPREVLEGNTTPNRASAEWRAGREVGLAEGATLVLDALREELLAAGVSPAQVPETIARVEARARAIGGST